MAVAAHAAETGEATGSGGVPTTSGGGEAPECDLWLQDCPDGSKCAPYDENATTTSIAPDGKWLVFCSNRGGKDPKMLDFATELPLWPGSNMVTVVARSNSEVRSVKTMFVYRDPPRTAQKP